MKYLDYYLVINQFRFQCKIKLHEVFLLPFSRRLMVTDLESVHTKKLEEIQNVTGME